MITGRGIITGRNQGKTPHDPLTIGSDAEHTLLVQVLSGADAAATQKGHIKLAGELTGTAALPTITSTHSGSAHHVAVTLATAGDTLLGLSGQAIDLDTQAANLLFAGPVSGAAAAPTFRALVDADFPATLNPTFAGLGATPIITSYTGPHAIGVATNSQTQFRMGGAFVSSATVYGFFFFNDLTPGDTNKAGFGFINLPTIRMVAGQTHSSFIGGYFSAPIIVAASGATVTEATTFKVAGAPTAGISNYAVNVLAGASRFGALTASLPVVTDSDKVLASLAYTGATSFRKNLGLETDDSPTFTGLTVGSLAGVLKATAGVLAGSAVHADLGSIGANDHHNAITLDANADTLLSLSTQALGLDTQAANLIFVGPTTGAAAVPTFRAMVAADLGTALTPTFAGIVIADAGTIGLGAGKGLIQFDDETTDFISFSNCKVGIGTTTPGALCQVGNLTETVPATYTGSLKVTGATQSTLEGVGGIELPVAGDGYSTKIQALSAAGAALVFAGRQASATWSEYIRIDSGGKVGIGTTAPGSKLEVMGTGAGIVTAKYDATKSAITNEVIRLRSNEDTNFFRVGFNLVGAAAQADRYLRIQTTEDAVGNGGYIVLQPDGGKVGVGDVAPGELLDVAGNINCTGVYKVDDVQVVSNQGAHVDDATDAASVITQFNLLLTRLETHGLIASA